MTMQRIVSRMLGLLLCLAPACAAASAGTPALQVVSAGRITALADRVVRSAVSDPERALAPAFVIADQRVPLGQVALSTGVPQVNATYVSVPIAILIDGTPARTIFAGYRITTYVRTAVAAHDLAPDTIVQPDDVELGRVPFAGRPALDVTTFIGRKVRGTIARGTILYPELTVVNLIVHAGMPAVLIVHDGPVSVAADVVARTSGGLGEFVTIFDPQTQKALSGVVTAPNTVELTLPGAD